MKTTDDTDILTRIDEAIDAHSQFTLARRVERLMASAAAQYEVGYEDTPDDPHQDECDFNCDMRTQDLVFDVSSRRIAHGTDDDGSEWATYICKYLVARNIFRPEDLDAWSPHVISPHITPTPYPPGFRRPRQTTEPDTSAQTRDSDREDACSDSPHSS